MRLKLITLALFLIILNINVGIVQASNPYDYEYGSRPEIKNRNPLTYQQVYYQNYQAQGWCQILFDIGVRSTDSELPNYNTLYRLETYFNKITNLLEALGIEVKYAHFKYDVTELFYSCHIIYKAELIVYIKNQIVLKRINDEIEKISPWSKKFLLNKEAGARQEYMLWSSPVFVLCEVEETPILSNVQYYVETIEVEEVKAIATGIGLLALVLILLKLMGAIA